MLFVTGPLYSGKRTFSQKFGGRQICDVQNLAANATDLEKLADELAAYDVVIATEIGGGIVPMDGEERAWRERHGTLVQQLARRAKHVTRILCGLTEELK